MENRTFSIGKSTHKVTYVSPNDPIIKRILISLVENASGQKKVQKAYDRIQRRELNSTEIWGVALELLEVKPVFDPHPLTQIPKEGPLVFISNHPFGVVDGLILGYLASCVRDRFVVLVHEVLCRQDARLAAHMLPIDFRENKDAIKINLRTRSIALERLRQGEAMVIFPAGGVSTSPRGLGKADDLEWKRFTAKVIQMAGATVVPVFVHGQNSRLFQLVSQLSQTLRYGMLLNEVRNKMGRELPITIGEPIAFEAIKHIKDRQELLDHLRKIVYALE